MTEIPKSAYSKMDVCPHTKPRNWSNLGSRYKVEQCGEFVHRYFKSHDKHYPTVGQPLFFFNVLNHNDSPESAWRSIVNGGITPPKAGDILVAKGKGSNAFHSALITEVSAMGVTVLQANVPYNWEGQPIIEQVLSLEYDKETEYYYMPNLPTSNHGYKDDYAVLGWISGTTPETRF